MGSAAIDKDVVVGWAFYNHGKLDYGLFCLFEIGFTGAADFDEVGGREDLKSRLCGHGFPLAEPTKFIVMSAEARGDLIWRGAASDWFLCFWAELSHKTCKLMLIIEDCTAAE